MASARQPIPISCSPHSQRGTQSDGLLGSLAHRTTRRISFEVIMVNDHSTDSAGIGLTVGERNG